MEQRYKSLIKNVGYLTISNFASKILVFLLVPLYTSVLSTEEYGSYDAIVTTIQIIAPVLIANISDGVMRFLLDDTKDHDNVINIGCKYITLGIGLSGLLILIIHSLKLVSFFEGFELYAFGYATVYILHSFYVQYAKGVNRLSLMAIAGVIGTLTVTLTNILFLLVFKLGVRGFFLANILGLAVPTAYLVVALKAWRNVKLTNNNSALQKEMLSYSLPLVFNTIGWTINNSLDKYCIIYFIGLSASGLLAVSYKIPTILSIIYAMFTQAWQISAVTEYSKSDRNEFYSKTFLFTNSIGVFCCCALTLLNRPLARILFQKEFYDAWKYVPFLLISALFNQTAGFIGPLLSAKKQSNAMAIAALWGTISNFVLNIVLIMIFGIQGAAVATAMSSFIIYYVRWHFAKELLLNSIYKRLYLNWIILLFSAITEVLGIPFYFQFAYLTIITILNQSDYKKICNMIHKTIRSKIAK